MQEQWGKLSEVPFPQLLHTIFTAKDAVSVLDLESGKIKKRVFFKSGIPVSALSNVLNEVLGRLMVKKGIITQETYEKSLEIMLKEKRRQGEVLIANKYITPAQLNDALTHQMRERLYTVFTLADGVYHHYHMEQLPKELPLSPVHPGYAILYSVKNGYYPMNKVKAAIEEKQSRIIHFSQKTAYTLEDFHPTVEEKGVLKSIDGKKNLRGILDGKEEFSPFLFALLVTNVLVAADAVPLKKEEVKKVQEPSLEDKALLERLTAEYRELKSKNYFEILGIGHDAGADTIKKAYFKQAKEYHPDKYHTHMHELKTTASDIFTLINTAYNTLNDEKVRKAYEQSLKSGVKQDITQDAANIMNAELQFQKGKVALSRQDYKSAKEAFEWTIKLNPNEGEYKAFLGWTIFNLSPKDPSSVVKAKELIEEGISSNPNQDRAYYFIGVLHRIEGRLKEAEEAFQKAVKRNPHLSEAVSELRYIQMKIQKQGKSGFFKKLFE